MRSTFHGLEVSKRGLYAQQNSLNTVNHNIANANTEGYTRQRTTISATNPIEVPSWSRSTAPGQLGTGVEVTSIERVRENYLDRQYRNENKSLGEWEIRSDSLDKIEAIVNEPSDTGLRKVIEDFWNSWQTLSQEPDNPTSRTVLKEKTIALTDSFNTIAEKLNNLTDDLNNSIAIEVNEVNSLTSQISKLNQEIYKVESLGDKANDLRDQRDLLTDQLSKLVNIDVTETSTGYTIMMGGTELVNGKDVTTVLSAGDIDGYISSGDLNSGEIYGYAYSRDNYVAQYRQQLDSMVQAIAYGEVTVTLPKGTILPIGSTVNGVTIDATNQLLTADTEVTVQGINGLHKLGYTLEEPLTTGEDFFTIKPGYTSLTAESIQLNPNIEQNVNKIAASTSYYTDAAGTQRVLKGNGELALAAAGIKNKTFTFDPALSGGLSSGTMDEFYQSIVGDLGVKAQEAKRQENNEEILIGQIDAMRQSVSGVSLDEEMANMIKFEKAYNASARIMTTMDEMLDKLINGTGIVGR